MMTGATLLCALISTTLLSHPATGLGCNPYRKLNKTRHSRDLPRPFRGGLFSAHRFPTIDAWRERDLAVECSSLILDARQDDLRRGLADFRAAGIHRGKLLGQPLEKLHTIETRQPDLAGDIDPRLEAVEHAAGTDHVMRI